MSLKLIKWVAGGRQHLSGVLLTRNNCEDIRLLTAVIILNFARFVWAERLHYNLVA